MKNNKWYYHDKNEWKYKLTDKAPQKAIDSYNEYYKLLETNDYIEYILISKINILDKVKTKNGKIATVIKKLNNDKLEVKFKNNDTKIINISYIDQIIKKQAK